MDVLSGTYILPIVKMDISKYTQTFIKDHRNNMQVMIGKDSVVGSAVIAYAGLDLQFLCSRSTYFCCGVHGCE